MPNRHHLLLALAAPALALAACSRGGGEEGANNLASLDNQLTANGTDPALTSALADQIAVDPTLSQQSNQNAVRPPDTPRQAPYPAGDPATGASASSSRQQLAGAGGACSPSAAFDYNAAWANRLPAPFAVYPGGKVTEAAGTAAGDCRIVTFATGDDWKKVLNWYHGRAVGAGYSSEHQVRQGDHILAGTKGEGAFFLIVTPKQTGSDVALIANKGG